MTRPTRPLILFDNDTEDYSFLESHFPLSVHSPSARPKPWAWTVGCLRAIRRTQAGDRIVCWFDFQAVMAYWMCRLLGIRRTFLAINIMLKQKTSWRNRMTARLYRSALRSDRFDATFTSAEYRDAVCTRLGVGRRFPIVHDVFHPLPTVGPAAEGDGSIFCGGHNGRDWTLMAQIARTMPHRRFRLVLSGAAYQRYAAALSAPNIEVLCDISAREFADVMGRASLVCLPLDTEAPAGLVVLFHAVALRRPVLVSSTMTTREYLERYPAFLCADQDAAVWGERAEYLLTHPAEASEAVEALNAELGRTCSEALFTDQVCSLAYAATDGATPPREAPDATEEDGKAAPM